MKTNVNNALCWMALLSLLLSGLSVNAAASGGPAPLPGPGGAIAHHARSSTSAR
jgi:hypothetical protein